MNTLPDKPNLKDFQQHLDSVCREKGWDKHNIAEVFLLLNEEIGELAKEIRKSTGFKGEKRTEHTKDLELELADVFNYILEIANRFDIDLEMAYRRKQEINQKRIWN